MVTLQGSNFGVSAIGRDIDGCMRYRNPEAMDITQCLAGTLSFLARDGHRGSQESGPQTHKSRAVCPGAPPFGAGYFNQHQQADFVALARLQL